MTIAITSLAVVALLIVAGSLFAPVRGESEGGSTGPAAPLHFVGSETCMGCHGKEGKLWRASQHAHAMAHASDATVLGDFNNASLDHFGVHSRFFKRNGKFFVETDGTDGKLTAFQVSFTFGVYPLQQYLVEFPDGRIQALPLAWDSRPKAQGGQRWFDLHPDRPIPHTNVLHWTKLNQNWNYMCAECHSTGVHKNYNAAKDSYHTTWSEISVGCEACHGQGSRHVAWAKAQQTWRWWLYGKEDPHKGLLALFDERRGVTWRRDPKTGNPRRSTPPAQLRKEVEACGRCHARRGQLSENWVPGHSLSDTHVIAMLTQGLYQADGQMLDEVYNYGSFKQSKMFAAGVTCSDCHDPHSAKLRFSGDQVCTQCHSSHYESAEHTHHAGVTPAVGCPSCHMPVRTYMQIDRRRDHSFRAPRPDLSVKFGVSNACNDCHTDKTPTWAAAAIETWYGPKRVGFQHYTAAFHAAWTDQLDAGRLLEAVAADGGTPDFARASALSALADYLSNANIDLAEQGLKDPDPLVRIGALDMLQDLPPLRLWPLVAPLLSDPVRGVRVRAASLLAGMPTDRLTDEERSRLNKASQEFIAAQDLNADRPEARAALGNFYMRRGQTAKAETEYKAALRLSPAYAPAAVNLADLFRRLGRNEDALALLREAIQTSPQDASLHHALGLTLVRLKHTDEGLQQLRQAVELAPNDARYTYVYAIGLDSTGHRIDAITLLQKNLARHPNDRDTLIALIGYSRDQGDKAAALKYAEALAETAPDDRSVAALVKKLRGEISSGNR